MKNIDFKKVIESRQVLTNKDEGFEVGITIYMQLGGPTFRLMTGSGLRPAIFPEYFSNYGLDLTLQENKTPANGLAIILNGGDLYDLIFYKQSSEGVEIIAQHLDCYDEMLRSIFTEVTGLYCTFGQKR